MKKGVVFIVMMSFLLTGSAEGRGLTGKVLFAVGSMALVASERSIEVIKTEPWTTFKEAGRLTDIETGETITVEYSRTMAGVKIADEIARLPRAALHQSLVLSTPELIALMAEDQDRFSLIDVRGRREFNEGHIPGAISMPFETIGKSGAPCAQYPGRMLVFYCEGPQCDRSHVALRAARLRGCMNTKVYNEGVRGWVAAREFLMVAQAHIRALSDSIRKGSVFLIDTRTSERYAASHISGAISVPLEEMRREDFIGPSWEPRVIFYGEDRTDERAEKAARLAIQWGYHLEGTSNAPVGMLAGGIEQWRSARGAVEQGKGSRSLVPPPQAGEIDFTEFQRLWSDAGKDVLFLDVRPGSTSNVSWVITISYEDLPFALKRLPKDREIIDFCSAGYRAMIAYHILAKNGFRVRFLKRDLTILPDGTVQ